MSNRILISNLPLNVDSGELEDMFMSVGNVVNAIIEKDQASGLSIGIGFVEMETEQAMRDGIDHFNGQSKFGNRLNVREDKPHVAAIPLNSMDRRKTFANAKSAFKKKSKRKH